MICVEVAAPIRGDGGGLVLSGPLQMEEGGPRLPPQLYFLNAGASSWLAPLAALLWALR
jgi:hypothetical protein